MSGLGSSSNPELHRLLPRSIDDELLSRLVVGGSGFDAPRVGAVAEFSERKAADFNEVLTILGELFVLLSAHVNYRLVIKLQVHCELSRQVVIVEQKGCAKGYEGLEVIDYLAEGLDLADLLDKRQHLVVNLLSIDLSRVLLIVSGHESFLIPQNVREFLMEV